MGTHSIEAELEKYFSRSTLSDWEKIATQELGGKNPFESLSWRGKDDILFLPYYDSSKDAHLHFLKGFHLPAATSSSPRAWLNLPHVTTKIPQSANAVALDHLLQGADGICFDLRTSNPSELNKLMHNIQWAHCYLAFFLKDSPADVESITHLIRQNSSPASIQGALFWESIPKKNHSPFYVSGSTNVKTLGISVAASTSAEEIAEALIAGVKMYDAFSVDVTEQNVFDLICFSLPADSAFLESVAKFKALRMLWVQIAHAYGRTAFKPEALFIHARVEERADSQYAPREGMLRSAFASMAAILGGCDALSIESAEEDELFSRWSRNVSSVLREESFLDRTADPLAGAWALDEMTNSIAMKAWELFQQKWTTYAS